MKFITASEPLKSKYSILFLTWLISSENLQKNIQAISKLFNALDLSMKKTAWVF